MKDSGSYESGESRWTAVAERDRRAGRRFCYAVRTTGVFCRPGCASKLPSRRNVEFFNTADEAKAAGYRPCRRCRPDMMSPEEHTLNTIISACRDIEQADRPIKLSALAAAAGFSPYHFHRLFKKNVGLTPRQYGSIHRAKRFRGLLKSGNTVTEALYGAGFGSSSRLYEDTEKERAMQPKAYKNGGRGVTIHYGFARCFLGWVMVAVTERGICAVEFADEQATLPLQLQNHFPGADLKPAAAGFNALIEAVVSFIEKPQATCKLPLDIQGTVFQQKVWRALGRIVPGRTASYGEIAREIGSPHAVRAVAQACGSNRLAVLIPCHRVIYKDGRTGGYRWGVERKQQLLEHEKKI